MSSWHMFYGLELDRLKAIFGSKDAKSTAEILKARKRDIEDWNAQAAEDEEDDYLKCEQALREIVAGSFGQHEHVEAMYGYALEVICEHIGQRIGGDDVACVADHPYASQLAASGPPIPIPYDESDDSLQIGFLSVAQIPDEIKRIEAAAGRGPKRNLVLSMVCLLTGGRIGRQMNKAMLAGDMAAYRKTLSEALDKNLAVVSFRH